MDGALEDIVGRCLGRKRVSIADCEYMMSFPEDSEESGYIILSADAFVKERCNGVGEVGVQIGVIVGPCYVDCGFCNFAYSITDVEDFTMGDSELRAYLNKISEDGIVSSVSLMTIHDPDMDDYLRIIETARSVLPECVRICANTGDLDPWEAKDLREAGIASAYHAVRLGESIDNRLEPMGRFDTIRNLREAGIEVAAGVEPIGPEHSVGEICRLYNDMMDAGCRCCSASARVPVPGTRLFSAGSISDRRLRQIRSSLMLSTAYRNDTELGFYGGFYGGFNRFYGEYSNSPKDREELSEKGMSHTVRWALDRLSAEGYGKVRKADGSIVPVL